MDKEIADSVEAQFRSVFPAGAFTQVNVLGYGDDPDVEPGETAIRAFVNRAGHPAGTFEDDEKVIRSFEKANGRAITWLHRDGQLQSGYMTAALSAAWSSGAPTRGSWSTWP